MRWPSRLEIPRVTRIKSSLECVKVARQTCPVMYHWFHSIGVRCLSIPLVPPRVFVLLSPLGLSIVLQQEGGFSHLHSLPAARPGCPVPPVVEGWHSKMVPSPHSMGEKQLMDHLRVNRGLGILVHPSPPVWVYLQPTSFIGRIFPSLHTWGGRDLGSVLGSQFCSWRIESLSFWKLSRTYSGEKPPSFFIPTQGWWLAIKRPTLHLLAIPTIPVG